MLEVFKDLQVALAPLVRQVQLVYLDQQEVLENLQSAQQHLQQVQLQVMLGLILTTEKLMFITIVTGLKLVQRL
jgi:hypothetical protein